MRAKRLYWLMQPVLDHPGAEAAQPTAQVFQPARVPLKRRLQNPGILLMVAVAVLLMLASRDQSLMAFDEGIYAQQARWMLTQGDWFTVGWWGTPQFDHAIGFSWLIALSLHWWGQGEWAVRLPTMVASWLGVLLTWRLGLRVLPAGGLWGGAILAVLPLWMQASKLGVPYVMFTTVTLGIIWAMLRAEESFRRRWLWGSVMGLLLNVGFLTVGMSVLLPVLALLPYLIGERHRHRHLTNKGVYWGLGLGAVPTLVWLGVSGARYGWLPMGRMLQLPFANLRDLFLGSVAQPFGGNATAFYYLWHLPAVTFPWVVLTLLGLGLVWRNPAISRKKLWLGFPLVYFALLMVVAERSDYMALVMYPFLALLAGIGLNFLARLFRSPRQRHYRVALGFGWGLGVLAILLLSAGGALVITPGELISPELKLYGWLAIAVGAGWLVPWLISVNRNALVGDGGVSAQVAILWQVGWLLGPGFAIATLFLTGLWGNYSPEVKTVVQSPPVAPVLADHAIHFIQPQQERDDVLLSFYTPRLGERLSGWQDVPAGEYAWGNSRLLPLPNDAYTVVGELNGWQLVQALE